jgi:hypothetical protein
VEVSVILRWLAIGGLFLMINAMVIVYLSDESNLGETENSGLPDEVLFLIQPERSL